MMQIIGEEPLLRMQLFLQQMRVIRSIESINDIFHVTHGSVLDFIRFEIGIL